MKAAECYEQLAKELRVQGEMSDSMRFLLTEFDENHEIERRNAASILHVFCRDILNMPDCEDISASLVLADLYDCRVCAASIMQMYSQGIMKAIYPLKNGRHIFGGRDVFTTAELDEIIDILKKTVNITV